MAESSDSFYSLNSQSQSSQQEQDSSWRSFPGHLDSDELHELMSFDPPSGHIHSQPTTTTASTTQGSGQSQDMNAIGFPLPTAEASSAGGGERASKRRRLNNGAPSRPGALSRPGASRENSIDLTDDDESGPAPDLLLQNQPPPIFGYYGPSLSDPTPRQSHSTIRQATGPGPVDSQQSRNEPAAAGNSESSGTRIHHQQRHHSRGPSSSSHSTRDSAVQTVDLVSGRFGPSRSGGNDAGGLEAIDLTTVNDTDSLRRRQEIDDEQRRMKREASMKIEARRKANEQMLRSTLAQQVADTRQTESEHTGLGAMQCVICMDSFTDMTATHCGHLFCHTCINEHLITAEMSTVNHTSLCPFCRQQIYRIPRRKKEEDKTIVPLVFKVKSKGICTADKGKQREVEKPD